jgi:hypothetical protein
MFGGRVPFATALLESVAIAVHLQDIYMMCEPIEQGAGQALRAEDFGPLLERKVGSDQR